MDFGIQIPNLASALCDDFKLDIHPSRRRGPKRNWRTYAVLIDPKSVGNRVHGKNFRQRDLPSRIPWTRDTEVHKCADHVVEGNDAGERLGSYRSEKRNSSGLGVEGNVLEL